MRIFIILIITVLLLSCGGTSNEALEHYSKGSLHFKKKEFKKAKVYLDKAINEDSNFSNAYLLISKIYYFNKKYDRALEYQEKIMDRDPDHIGALYWKARTLVISKNSNDKEAISCLNRVIELNSHHIYARSLLALIYEKRKDYKKAIHHYQYIHREQEALINARANLSILYKRLGLKERSLNEINTAIGLAKLSGVSFSNLETIKREIE